MVASISSGSFVSQEVGDFPFDDSRRCRAAVASRAHVGGEPPVDDCAERAALHVGHRELRLFGFSFFVKCFVEAKHADLHTLLHHRGRLEVI